MVIKIKDYFIEWQVIDYYSVGVCVGEVFLDVMMVLIEFQYVVEVIIGYKDCCFDMGFFKVVDFGYVGYVGGVVYFDYFVVFYIDVIDY